MWARLRERLMTIQFPVDLCLVFSAFLAVSNVASAQRPKVAAPSLPVIKEAEGDEELRKLLIIRYNEASEELKVAAQLQEDFVFSDGFAFETTRRCFQVVLETSDEPRERTRLMAPFKEYCKRAIEITKGRVAESNVLRDRLALHRTLAFAAEVEIELLRCAQKEGKQKKD